MADPEKDLTATERYATYLFDSLAGEDVPYYSSHEWNGSTITISTDAGFDISLKIDMSMTKMEVAQALQRKYEEALEAQKDEQEGYSFDLVYMSGSW